MAGGSRWFGGGNMKITHSGAPHDLSSAFRLFRDW